MIAVVAVPALPFGCLVRNRTAAFVAFGVLVSHVDTLQAANVVMERVNGADAGFSQDNSTRLLSWTLGYVRFTTLVLAVGAALLVVGVRRGARRDVRTAAADLDVAVR